MVSDRIRVGFHRNPTAIIWIRQDPTPHGSPGTLHSLSIVGYLYWLEYWKCRSSLQTQPGSYGKDKFLSLSVSICLCLVQPKKRPSIILKMLHLCSLECRGNLIEGSFGFPPCQIKGQKSKVKRILFVLNYRLWIREHGKRQSSNMAPSFSDAISIRDPFVKSKIELSFLLRKLVLKVFQGYWVQGTPFLSRRSKDRGQRLKEHHCY